MGERAYGNRHRSKVDGALPNIAEHEHSGFRVKFSGDA
jgi:hypothetical protein